jgi:Mn-dependent DtxR family transcriptional regulator
MLQPNATVPVTNARRASLARTIRRLQRLGLVNRTKTNLRLTPSGEEATRELEAVGAVSG